MNLKEAYEKVKKDYSDWTIGYILEAEDMFIFCMHPTGDGIVLDLPVLYKDGTYSTLDILEAETKKEIRKINPKDL